MKKFAEIRSRCMAILESTAALLQRAGTPLKSASRYLELAAIVRNELEKVRDLELRMAIVAPMKAGKSTIINAILGQGLLPTRNSAMTTLPCEIVCESVASEPRLRLHPQTLGRFELAWQRLHTEIGAIGVDAGLRATASYPELADLLRQVAGVSVAPLSSEVVGAEGIQRALCLLNDLCRLAPAVVPGLSPLSGDEPLQVPRLSVPFLNLPASGRADGGRLVIVDTPGPNEARHHQTLRDVIAEQLRSTSIVLIVLDFTQLNTEAAELVSRSVQDVVSIVGEENLLILINKIDERTDKSMTAEEVRQFVASHLKLREAVAKDRLFEVSAKQAYCASTFLHEVTALGAGPAVEAVRAVGSAKDLARQVFGVISWEDELADATTEQLTKRATRLWALSQFDPFLSQALDAVMADAAPRCVSIAARVASAHLRALRNDAKVRSKGLKADAVALKQEMDSLSGEIDNLKQARTAIEGQVTEVREDLRRQLDSTRRGLQQATALNVADVFREKQKDRETFGGRLRRYGSRFINLFGLGPTPDVPKDIVFESQEEASEFAAVAVEYAVDELRPDILAALSRVDRRIDRSRREVEASIEDETRPILRRAAQRLRKEFDVKLEIPRPNLGNPLEAVEFPDARPKVVPGGFSTEVRYERKWYVLWLYKVRVEYQVKQNDLFHVSLDGIGNSVNDEIQSRLDETARRFDVFLEGEFADRIDTYFTSLREYLSFYRSSMHAALEAQRTSLEERTTTSALLSQIVAEAESLGEESEAVGLALDADGQGKEGPASGDLLDEPVDLFFCYSHVDEPFRDQLETHLALLQRQGVIRTWHDRKIGPGKEWEGAIDDRLTRARIVLLLVSSDFIASDYCYDVEVQRAMQMHAEERARVIPVILRHCDWKGAPFGKLQALPTDARPVKAWDDVDEAFAMVVKGLRATASALRSERQA